MNDIILGIGSRIKHFEFGTGVVIQVKTESILVTFVEHGLKKIMKNYNELEIIEAVEPQEDLISFEDIETSLIKIFNKYADIQQPASIADKWRGGKLIFEPADQTKPGKDMLIDVFFHKIVMVRDRLRVMEQRINSSKLNDDEKVNLQQYVTRIYGSLTSFNVLFKNKSDHFVGSKS